MYYRQIVVIIYIYIYNRYVVIQERHRHCSRCVIVVHLCARARGGVDVKICIVVGGGQQQPFVGRANREPADPPKIYFFLSYCFSSVTPVREANCGKPPRRAFSIVQQCIIVINIYRQVPTITVRNKPVRTTERRIITICFCYNLLHECILYVTILYYILSNSILCIYKYFKPS